MRVGCSDSLKFLLILSLVLLSFFSSSHAFEFKQSVSLEERYDSNLFLREENEGDEISSSITYEFLGFSKTRKLDFSIDSAIGYRSYTNDSIDPDYFGRMGVKSIYTFDQVGQYKWVVLNNLRQDLIDSDGAFISGNLEHKNKFSTGPRINLSISQSSQLLVDFLYVDERTEDEDEYTVRKKGNAAVNKKFSDTHNFSINFSAEEASVHDTDPSQNKNFPIHQTAYLKFDNTKATNSYYLAVGGTALDSEWEPYAGLGWARSLNSSNRISFDYLRDFNLDEEEVDDENLLDLNGEEVLDDRLKFTYEHDAADISTFFSLTYRRKDFVNNTVEDQSYYGFRAEVRDYYSNRSMFDYYLHFTLSDKSNNNSEQKDALLGTALTLIYSRGLNFVFRGEYDTRFDSNNNDFKNISLFLLIRLSS